MRQSSPNRRSDALPDGDDTFDFPTASDNSPIGDDDRAGEISLTELQQRLRESELLRQLAIKANEAASGGEAIQACLDAVCAHLGWPIGHAYMPATDGSGELETTGLWHIDDPGRYETLRRVTGEIRYAYKQSLPDRVLAMAAPQWMLADTTYQHQPRTKARIEAGLRSGFAFPAMAGDTVVAVLEFFSPDSVKPDPRFLSATAEIGILVGQVIERKQTERELSDSEERYRELAELSPDGMLVHIDGEIVFANASLARILAVPSPADLIGKNTTELLAPEYRTSMKQRRKKVLEGEISASVQVEFVRSDGSRVLVERTATQISWEGNPAIVVLFRDISERAEAERAVAESHDQLHLVTDNLPVWITYIDAEQRYRFVNKTCTEWLARPAEEIVGKTVAELMGQSYEKIQSRIERSLAGEHLTEIESIVYPDGVARTVRVTNLPHRGTAENVVGTFSLVEDISDLKQAEEAQHESYAQLRAITENSHSAILLKDTEGRYIFANQVWHDMRNPVDEEFIGKTVYDFYPRDFADAVTATDNKVLETGEPVIVQELVPNAAGDHSHMLSSKFPVRDADGNIVAIGGIDTDITERVATEQALHERDAQFRAFADNSLSAMFLKDTDGRYILVNKVWHDEYNPAGIDPIGLTADEFFPPEIANITAADDKLLLETGEPIVREQLLASAQGGQKHALSTKFPVRDDDGNIIAIGGYNTDISERVAAERALRDSEAHLRAITENSPSAILLKDTNSRYIFANRIWHGMNNPTGADIIGKTAHDFLPPQYAEDAAIGDKQVLETGVPITRERNYTNGMVEPHSVLQSKFPVRDADGDIIGVGIVNTDITERVAAERALRDSEAHLTHAQRIANLGSWTWELNTDTLTWSDALYQLMQIDPVEAADPVEAFYARIHPDDREEVAQIRQQLKQTGHQEVMEFRINLPNGEERFIRTQWVTEQDQSGHPVRAIGITQDVTEVQQSEAALRQAQKMEAVGQLTGGVAHDFNNLLAVVLGNTELLRDEIGDHGMLASIDHAATRGAELTQRLLAFSRQQALHPQSVDLAELVSGIEDLFHRTLGEPVKILIHVPDNIWPVLADPAQLESALLNLAINARDAMPTGGILEIGCENVQLYEGDTRVSDEVAAGDYVQISARDTGTGIPEDVLKHVFEPFYTTKDVGEGSGLGLSMVYGFTRQSGGDAIIESKLGTGTEVTMFLPRAAADARSSEPAGDETRQRGKQENILVLEDDPDVRFYAVAALVGLGYCVLEAANANAAMRILEDEAGDIDLLLCDVVLPGGVSGPKVAAKAKDLYPDLKIVFMSGYNADVYAHDKIPSFDETLLTKPFRLAELSKAIHDTLAE